MRPSSHARRMISTPSSKSEGRCLRLKEDEDRDPESPLLQRGQRPQRGSLKAGRLEISLTEVAMKPGRCQVRIYTESPCPRRADVEIFGVAFCGPCARQQEAYFSIGELTHEEGRNLRYENRGSLSLGALARGLLDNPS